MKRIFIVTAMLLPVFVCSAATVSGRRAKKIRSYFTARLQGDSCVYGDDKRVPVKKIAEVRNTVWNEWCKAVNGSGEEKLLEPFASGEPRDTGYWHLPQELEPDAQMPYYFIKKGDAPQNGYPLFLYMHGSGNKVREWETGLQLCFSYNDSPSLHFIPQIPREDYYRWAIQSKQWAWEKLLRQAFVSGYIDAGRIYFYGISEGGYGSQRLASFYADYLAGAGPMAGGEPLKNAPMENLANIAFSLRTGEFDYSFGRNVMTNNAAAVMDSLRAAHPGLYNHFIEIVPKKGHGIDYDKTTPWLAKYSRNAHPRYFYWEDYDMYGRHRTGFYNIRVDETSRNSDDERTCYEVNINDNVVELEVKNVSYTTTKEIVGIPMFFDKKYSTATKGKVTVYLNEKLFDLSKPVKVIVNGKEKFNGKVKPSLKAFVESCAEFFDPERVFPASVTVEIGE